MNNPWHLAIDFGTSNSAAAHTAPLTAAVETLPLSHRSNLVPSAVYVNDDGSVLYGEAALSQGRRNPSRMVVSPKRYIGHELVQLAGKDVPLKDLMAALFRGVLEKGCAQHAGQTPASITITHPESWSVHNVDTLLGAATSIGVPKDVLRTITEPRAAAMHYAAKQKIPPGSHVAVFDFGGGTLDIAVLRAEPTGDFRVIAAKGDNSLGGRTIDNLLYRWVIDQVEKDDPDLADELHSSQVSIMHSLDESIREAKEMLSDTSSATITVSTPHGEQDFLITRDEFNEVISGVVDRAVELTQSALQQAGVDRRTPIYMTGGSSRIPYVQNRLGEVAVVMTLDDPKTVVARGALEATMLGFTEGTGNIVVPKPTRPDNPFGEGPGTLSSVTASAAAAPNLTTQFPTQPDPSGREVATQGAQTLAATSTATPSKSKKGGKKKLVIAVVAVVALLGVSAVAYRMLGTKSTVTQVNTTAKDSDIPLLERYSTANQFLPAKLLNVMQRCSGKADEYNDHLTVPVYQCGLSNDDDAPKMDDSKPSYIYWVPGDQSETAHTELQSGKVLRADDDSTIHTSQLQESSSSKPEVGLAFPKTGSGFVYMYYPKDKFTLYFEAYGQPSKTEITEYLKYLGVMS